MHSSLNSQTQVLGGSELRVFHGGNDSCLITMQRAAQKQQWAIRSRDQANGQGTGGNKDLLAVIVKMYQRLERADLGCVCKRLITAGLGCLLGWGGGDGVCVALSCVSMRARVCVCLYERVCCLQRLHIFVSMAANPFGIFAGGCVRRVNSPHTSWKMCQNRKAVAFPFSTSCILTHFWMGLSSSMATAQMAKTRNRASIRTQCFLLQPSQRQLSLSLYGTFPHSLTQYTHTRTSPYLGNINIYIVLLQQSNYQHGNFLG